ncbi:uncharacterized protein LOC105214413 [Zeugodacus cucurbitae]|nr:uncharacterized protein LOC105214413 [Zeugodacus cucurbitae]
MVRIRGMRCGLANHLLQEPSTKINDSRLTEFVRKRRKDFRPEVKVCKQCAEELVRIYNLKITRALELQRASREWSLNVSSVADVEDSNTSRQQRTFPTINISSSTTTRTTTGTDEDNTVNSRQQHTFPTINISSSTTTVDIEEQHSTSHSPLDEGPSTSAAAAARMKRKHQEVGEAHNAGNDDEYAPSPNAVNGTRLPHIQPIPKRRKFVHENPSVMAVYMAGLKGG